MPSEDFNSYLRLFLNLSSAQMLESLLLLTTWLSHVPLTILVLLPTLLLMPLVRMLLEVALLRAR